MTDGREVVAHVALALRAYVGAQRSDGVAVPPEVDLLARLLADSVRTRQDPPPIGDLPGAGQAGRMVDALLLTKAEAARELCTSVRTVERLIASAQLRAVKVEGATRVRRVDLTRYVEGLASSFAERVEHKGPGPASHTEGVV